MESTAAEIICTEENKEAMRKTADSVCEDSTVPLSFPLEKTNLKKKSEKDFGIVSSSSFWLAALIWKPEMKLEKEIPILKVNDFEWRYISNRILLICRIILKRKPSFLSKLSLIALSRPSWLIWETNFCIILHEVVEL